MVVRTTDRILVTEEQLDAALRVFEQALTEANLVADIEVTTGIDPDGEEEPVTLLVARLRGQVAFGLLWAAFPRVVAAVRDAGLLRPAIPLDVHVTRG